MNETTSPDRRAQAAAVLRAVADLIEQDGTVPVPETKVSFSIYSAAGEAGPGIVQTIMAALPGGWTARDIEDGGRTAYYDFNRSTGSTAIQIWTTAQIAGAQEGTKTVEVPAWQVSPEIAALLDEQPEAQA